MIDKIKVNSVEYEINDTELRKKFDTLPQIYAKKGEVPTKTSELENDSGFLTEHQSLEEYSLIADTGSKIKVVINSSTYVMTVTLSDLNGKTISTSSIDLPLETMVVNGEYDSTNKKIILTLKNGNKIEISVADLISGLETQFRFTNMPTASSKYNGKIFQYIGETDSNYTKSYFYKCLETVVASDEKLELSAGGVSGLGNITGNASTFGEKVDYIEDTFEFGYNGYPETIKVYTSGDDAILTRSRENDVDNAYAWITPSDTIVYSSVQAPTDIDRFYSTTSLDNRDEVNIYYSEDLTYSDSYGRWQTYDENMELVDVDLSDYGISYDGVTRVGAIIYATYTNSNFGSNEWVWEQIDVQPHQDLSEYAKKSDIPTKVSELENDSEYIKKTDTEITNKELLANKTTTIDSSSTDTEYPSAKAVYEKIKPTLYVDSEGYICLEEE